MQTLTVGGLMVCFHHRFMFAVFDLRTVFVTATHFFFFKEVNEGFEELKSLFAFVSLKRFKD